MGLKKKIIFAAFKDRFFRAGIVLPSSDCHWSLWEETKVDGCVSKTDLGWNINCSSTNRLCPSTVWIWFNNFASDLIRRATVSPLLRTLNFDLRVIVEESLYAIPGTALLSRVSGFFFLFFAFDCCLGTHLLLTFNVEEDQIICIFLIPSVNTDKQICTKERNLVQTQQRKFMSCHLARLGAEGVLQTNPSAWSQHAGRCRPQTERTHLD